MHCIGLGNQPSPASHASMDRLVDYQWPGNVRELENVIERGAARILAMHPNTLRSRMKKLGLTRGQSGSGSSTVS